MTFVGLRQFFAQEAVKRELDLATVVGWPIPDAVRLLTDGAAAGGKSGGGKTPTKAPAGKKPSINARMLETIQKDTAAMGWNSPKWARYLKCGEILGDGHASVARPQDGQGAGKSATCP